MLRKRYAHEPNGLSLRKHAQNFSGKCLIFLALLSRRLRGWPCSVVRRSSVVVRPQFQRSSPLKPLGQSKPNFTWSILRTGGPSHMTKMAAMPIYGKSHKKSSHLEPVNRIQRNLVCSTGNSGSL